MRTGFVGVFIITAVYLISKSLLELLLLLVIAPFLSSTGISGPEYLKLLLSLSFLLPLVPFLLWNQNARKKRGLSHGPGDGLILDEPDIARYTVTNRFWKRPGTWFILLIFLPAATQTLGTELDVVLHTLIPCDENFFQFLKFFAPTGSIPDLLGAYLTIGLIGPIGEEFFFRGIILTAPLRKYTKKMYIYMLFYQGLLFGLAHLTVWQIFYAIPMGILLGYLRMRTGSIFPPLIVHIVNNILAVVILYHFQENHSLDSLYIESCVKIEHVHSGYLFVSVVLLFASFLYLRNNSVQTGYDKDIHRVGEFRE